MSKYPKCHALSVKMRAILQLSVLNWWKTYMHLLPVQTRMFVMTRVVVENELVKEGSSNVLLFE
jgi:hypothetical protein